MSKKLIVAIAAAAVAVVALVLALRPRTPSETKASGAASAEVTKAEPVTLTVYSGRNEKLVGALFRAFEKESGVTVKVRYGETPELAALLLEEGARSPADVFVAQDAGALGALAKEKRLAVLPQEITSLVKDARFKSTSGEWVGLSGRARVLAYDTRAVKPEELPKKVSELTDAKWRGKIGWAPSNASFQAFVTAFRKLEGDEAAAKWLDGVKANEPRVYKNNTAVVEALARGEIAVGLVNHYYVFAASKDRKDPLPVQNHYFDAADPGALVNVAGAAVLASSKHEKAARDLVTFLLGKEAQAHFAKETFEYPLAADVAADPRITPIAEVGSPKLDLSQLDELQGTVRMLQDKSIL